MYRLCCENHRSSTTSSPGAIQSQASQTRSWYHSPTAAPQYHPGMSQLNPKLSQLNPKLSQLHPKLLQLNPTLSQLHPKLSQLNPSLSQLNPSLSQLNPCLSQLNPNLSQLNPNLSQLNPNSSSPCSRPRTSSLWSSSMHRVLTLKIYSQYLPYAAVYEITVSSVGFRPWAVRCDSEPKVFHREWCATGKTFSSFLPSHDLTRNRRPNLS